MPSGQFQTITPIGNSMSFLLENKNKKGRGWKYRNELSTSYGCMHRSSTNKLNSSRWTLYSRMHNFIKHEQIAIVTYNSDDNIPKTTSKLIK